ncbi:OmpA family protein [Roseivivax sp. THAF30]|uniref:OmpA family protein n=1 Tax=Roseivivax sp. THAF30 TaxID=2587852 RepID=UPI0012A99612|nr:OmpA family protein [Roseivivax sp. THAF30]QFT62833.1 flagellar motor protein MotB [Roseivivax sp. THAF30]
MTHRFLKTTTALVLSASLAMPAAVTAQSLDLGIDGLPPEQAIAELEAALDTPEVQAEPAVVAQIEQELQRLHAEVESNAEPEAEAGADANAEAEAEAAPEDSAVDASEPAEPAQPAEPETASEPAAAEEPADAADATPTEEMEPTDDAEPTDQAAESAPVEEPADAEPMDEAPDAEPVEETADTEPADEPADAEPMDSAEGGASTDEPTDAQPTDNSADAEPTDDGAAAEPTEDAADAEPMDAETMDNAADAEPADEATETEPTDSAVSEPTDGASDGEPAQTTDAEPTDEAEEAESAEATADTDGEAADPQASADAVSEDDAEAAAAAAASGDTEGAEVVEETVTDETARSSDEEFDTSIQQGAENAARSEDDDDDEDERNDDALRGAAAGLLGLGALAVGDLLRPNEQVVSNTGDRVVVERDGQYRVLRNDDALLRQPGNDVTTYRFDDGSTRTVVTRGDGSTIETIRSRDGRVLRRVRTTPNGDSVVLFDDTREVQQVNLQELPQTTDRRVTNFRDVDQDQLASALAAVEAQNVDRSFSLNQIRNIDPVRKLVPEVNVDTINFATGSAVIQEAEAQELSALGNAISQLIAENPGEVFLIEGHTDAVGSASYNLALSDRRAESVALALTEYFDVPPENLVIQGYGESDLLVQTEESEIQNRRAAVRRITPLLSASR